ncbi:MAG: sigma-70 family RNA polymerase sigma factor, partial [Gemmataceae bacterium]
MAGPPLDTILRNLRTLTNRQHAGRSDAELLARFVADRDEAAFEALVWRHGGLVYRLGRRLLGREADVEDAFQATFLILARDAARIGQRASLAGWLYRVAYRVAVRVRQRRRSFDALPAELPGPLPDPAEQFAERERCGLLLDEIARLPERYRLAVVLCCLQGKSNAQAASELGCPCGTIDSRLAWARRRLRDRLLRRGVAPALAGTLTLGLAWEAQAVAEKLAADIPSLAVAVAAGGQEAVSSLISRQSFHLLRGVHPMLSLSRIKVAVAALLLVAMIGVGAGDRKDARVAADDPPRPAATGFRPQEGEWQLQSSWKAGDGPVAALAFSPDGKGIAVGVTEANSKQGGITLYDPTNGKQIWQWLVTYGVKSVAFSPDGKRLASVEGGGVGVLREVPTGHELAALNGDLEVIGFAVNGDIYVG